LQQIAKGNGWKKSRESNFVALTEVDSTKRLWTGLVSSNDADFNPSIGEESSEELRGGSRQNEKMPERMGKTPEVWRVFFES
jgi:hypothetical protein